MKKMRICDDVDCPCKPCEEALVAVQTLRASGIIDDDTARELSRAVKCLEEMGCPPEKKACIILRQHKPESQMAVCA